MDLGDWETAAGGTCGATDDGSQGFVNGADPTPPLGTGAYTFTTNDFSFRRISTDVLNGSQPTDITALRYSTMAVNLANEQPYLQLRMDTNGDGESNETLFLIPANQQNNHGPTKTGVWQTWDGTVAGFNTNGDDGPQGTETLAQYEAANPTAEVVKTLITFGCGASGAQEAAFVDAVEIGTGDQVPTIYDFEQI